MELINLTYLCQGVQALPRAGGVLDQDHLIMRGMEMVLGAQALRDQDESKKIKDEADAARG